MTLKQIEAFYWAAKLGSFALAAQRLHITQSTLSKRIAEFESAVGASLFDRTTRRASLTPAGERLLAPAASMLEASEHMRSAVSDVEDLYGICRLGVTELGSLSWLPRFIRQARQCFPHLVFQPYVDLGRTLERMVQRGELDLAVVPASGVDAALVGHYLCEMSCVWMSAPARFATQEGCLSPTMLETLPVLTMTDGSSMTGHVGSWAIRHGIRLQPSLASNSLMAIIGLTMADVGISYLPATFMRPWIASGRLVALPSDPPAPSIGYQLVHRRDDGRALVRSVRELLMSAELGIVSAQWDYLGPV